MFMFSLKVLVDAVEVEAAGQFPPDQTGITIYLFMGTAQCTEDMLRQERL